MTKQYKIAVPIVGPEQIDVVKQSAEAVSRGADILEFRFDGVKGLNQFNVFPYANLFVSRPRIFTNRHPAEVAENDRGRFGYKGTEKERLAVLRTVASFEPTYLDVEHKHFHHVDVNPKKTKRVVSYHDFKHTPGYERLKQIYNEIADRRETDIVKMAFMVTDRRDNENLFRLMEYSLGKDMKPAVIVGMGELGEITRYGGPSRGSLWTFGALCKERQSAPGQPSIEKLRTEMQKY
ncbi:MAG: type I 3-dehydroquinate dehydratase [Nanoarchaeota archaeon]